MLRSVKLCQVFLSDYDPDGSNSPIQDPGEFLGHPSASSDVQTPLSHEEKGSGERSQISWARARFCDGVTYM